jgi:hypothetical protein
LGVWLNHPVSLIDQKTNRPVIYKIHDMLKGSIINEKGAPILGGTSQDKICASMLYNNTFYDVENKEDDSKYPWIKISSSIEDSKDIFPEDMTEKDYADTFTNSKGILKKYFWLWKGKELLEVDDEKDFKKENVNRFKFLRIINRVKEEELKAQARSEGVIRILYNTPLDEDDNENKIFGLYKQWLKNWKKVNVQINLEYTDTFCILKLENNKVESCYNYYNGEEFGQLIEQLNAKIKEVQDSNPNLVIPREKEIYYQDFIYSLRKNGMLLFLRFAHGENESPECIMDIRNHGNFVKYFPEAASTEDIKRSRIPECKLGEFIETVITCICIFDNRLFQRIVDKEKWILLDNVLGITFYEESREIWEDLKKGRKHIWINRAKKAGDEQAKRDIIWGRCRDFKDIPGHYHFLIIHLSFIEEMGYSEKDINSFIETEVIGTLNELPENFILTIVTGRGREEWWDEIDEKFKKYVTFRPIESLLTAVEDGVAMKDDFQIKYNLVKVLFGS